MEFKDDVASLIKTLVITLIILTIGLSTLTVSADIKKNPQATTENTLTTTSTTVKNKIVTKKVKEHYMYVNKNNVSIRNCHNKKGKVVKKVNLGKKVKVTAEHGNWRKVGKNKWIHKNHLSKKDPSPKYQGVKLKYSSAYNVTKNKLTRSKGVVYYQGHKETWYSQRVLPGRGLKIPGRHVADDGTIRDKDGYIVVAANYLSKGSRIMTSLGPAKVYDCGSMTGKWLDIYVDW